MDKMWLSLLLLGLAGHTLLSNAEASAEAMTVGKTPPVNASAPIPEAFVSYSIEFAFFPDFAGGMHIPLAWPNPANIGTGNCPSPNVFSNNLLNNLGNLTGTKPYIRVGGNTQ